MDKKEMLPIDQYTKVILPASSYNMQDDNRLLIPFTCGDKIGFANKEGEVVVKPQFTMYYGECYDESDNIMVTVDDLRGFARSGGKGEQPAQGRAHGPDEQAARRPYLGGAGRDRGLCRRYV